MGSEMCIRDRSKRMEKLGLEDYVKSMIVSGRQVRNQQTNRSHEFISKSLNQTWVSQENKERPNTSYFESRLGSKRNWKS